jgi:pimeloyl-ACP methyl ester carboxylesterase
VQDVIGLLDQENLTEIICFGTSMGGIMSMILATLAPDRVKAAMLNDIGPELDPAGLTRIQNYVGGKSNFSSWQDAANAVRSINASPFPNETSVEFWIDFAKRTCIELDSGEIVFDYDPAISNQVKSSEPAPDLWPFFDALSSKPVLVVRGEISDLLAIETVGKMKERCPHLQHVDVPDVGHAPLLTEQSARSAINAFLTSLSD